MGRQCAFRKEDGQMCQAAPVKDGDHCFWHSPSMPKMWPRHGAWED